MTFVQVTKELFSAEFDVNEPLTEGVVEDANCVAGVIDLEDVTH